MDDRHKAGHDGETMVPIASRGISFSIETVASSFHTACFARHDEGQRRLT
jgi:hypothetical protein